MSKIEALKELLYKIADNQLILGHRNSEWIGLGPTLEEDIAFGSLAQDKTGHAFNIYQMLEKIGEGDPDTIAFRRSEKDFKSSHLVELPNNGDYAFALARHFFFDYSELLRFEALKSSTYPELAGWSGKFYSEIKYHIFHANTWLKSLMNGNDESRAKMTTALKYALPYALGIFEEGKYEQVLIDEGLFIGETKLKAKWITAVQEKLSEVGIDLDFSVEPILGGRNGYHSEHLAPLLQEMNAVIDLEPSDAKW